MQVQYVKHAVTLYLLFTLVYGPDEGLIQSATCTERQQKENMSCVVTGDLSFSFIEFLTQWDVFC